MLFVLPSARIPRQQAQGSDSQGCGITNLSGCSFHSSAIKAEHLSRTGLSCRDGSPSFSWGCHIAAAQLSRQGITCTVPCQGTADATQHSSHCTEAFCPWEQSLAQLTASSCIQTCWVRGSLRGWGAAKVESRKKERDWMHSESSSRVRKHKAFPAPQLSQSPRLPAHPSCKLQ